jgi:hypothetical protein
VYCFGRDPLPAPACASLVPQRSSTSPHPLPPCLGLYLAPFFSYRPLHLRQHPPHLPRPKPHASRLPPSMSSLPPPDCPLLLLPLNILEYVQGAIVGFPTRIAFASTCKTLFKRYYIRTLLARLECLTIKTDVHGRWGRYKSPRLFCLTSGTSVGPFYISSVELSKDGHIMVGVTWPRFVGREGNAPTRSFMFVDYTGAGVGAEAAVMHHEYTKRLVVFGEGIFVTEVVDWESWEDELAYHDHLGPKPPKKAPMSMDLKRRTGTVPWKVVAASGVVRATRDRLRAQKPCSECKGKCTIEIDGNVVTRYVSLCSSPVPSLKSCWYRWPELAVEEGDSDERFMGHRVPCPRCTEDYKSVVSGLRDKMQEEDLKWDMEEEEDDYGSYRRSSFTCAFDDPDRDW